VLVARTRESLLVARVLTRLGQAPDADRRSGPRAVDIPRPGYLAGGGTYPSGVSPPSPKK
jgi:hypothetical protein